MTVVGHRSLPPLPSQRHGQYSVSTFLLAKSRALRSGLWTAGFLLGRKIGIAWYLFGVIKNLFFEKHFKTEVSDSIQRFEVIMSSFSSSEDKCSIEI